MQPESHRTVPLIRSIEKLADGVRITRTTGQVLTLTSANIPGSVTTTAQAQTFVNNWVAQQGFVGACRVRSISPLDLDIAVSSGPLPSAFGMA